MAGFEPVTSSLARKHSTTELHPRLLCSIAKTFLPKQALFKNVLLSFLFMKKTISFFILIAVLLLLLVIHRDSSMEIASSVFENNAKIPSKYTCDGEGINPPLSFVDVPENAKSLVLIVDDPDAPIGTFVHWILFNIDPKTSGIKENSAPEFALRGKTSAGVMGYVSPCPPSGIHRYFFKLFALDSSLDLKNPDKAELEEKMQNHILEKSELIGLYSKY
jgi:Raf kinase inhibitor-like YbhB/YbcL family protein